MHKSDEIKELERRMSEDMRQYREDIVKRNLWHYSALARAAEYLDVSPKTLRLAAKRGLVRHIRSGNQLLFTKDDLDAFVARRTWPVSESVEGYGK